MKTALTIVAMLALLESTASADTILVPIPIEREAILASPHKQNNDGAWGFGWVKNTGRMLLGFDLTPLEGRAVDVQSATIKLFVAVNQFNQTGADYDLHPYDINARIPDPGPSPGPDWTEGDIRFNTFAYCQQWSVQPDAVPIPGVTWSCPTDPNPLSAAVDCPPPGNHRSDNWAPTPQTGVQSGFKTFDFLQANRFPHSEDTTNQSADCEPDQKVQANPNKPPTCDPNCNDSLACFDNGLDPSIDPADCWRTVRIVVTSDVKEALTPGTENLHQSWLLKRREEVNTTPGSFHFFSREGAICILGGKDPGSPFAALRPVLEVTLTQQPGDPPTIPEPDPHCDGY